MVLLIQPTVQGYTQSYPPHMSIETSSSPLHVSSPQETHFESWVLCEVWFI